MVIEANSTFRVIHEGIEYEFEAAEEGGYTAHAVGYPSAISEGDTFEEALENVVEALKECLATARDLGLEVPASLAHVKAV